MNTSSWSEFADTFLAAEEQRSHQQFLARESLNLLSVRETTTVARRAVDAAIPLLGDICILALRSQTGAMTEIHFAYRHSSDEMILRELVSLEGSPLQALLERIQPLDTPLPLDRSELDVLHTESGGLEIHTASVSRIGRNGPGSGVMLFLEGRSQRSYTEDRLRLIRDFSALVGQSLLRTSQTDFLKQEIVSRERLISIAAHELSTPLTALHLQVELLRRHLKQEGISEKADTSLTSMSSTISSLSESLGMLFNLSEIQHDQVVLQKEPSDLAAVIRNVVSRLDALMKRSNCTVHVNLPEKANGYFDSRRIEQAITNLLANSAKYAPRCEVTIALRSDGNAVEIEIGDNGPGIPEAHHQRIFEAFRRVASDQGVRGLGLGLFISRAVARAHGGELLLISQPGEGAKFLLKLPLWEV